MYTTYSSIESLSTIVEIGLYIILVAIFIIVVKVVAIQSKFDGLTESINELRQSNLKPADNFPGGDGLNIPINYYRIDYLENQTDQKEIRRHRLNLMVPAEVSITVAMMEVERMPADERLTKAVMLLSEAKDCISDFIDDDIRLKIKLHL